MNFAQPDAQVLADLGVERAERLVEQEHARLDGERAGEGDALLLSAGELRGIARSEVAEPHDVEQFVDARRDLALRRPRAPRPHGQAIGDIVEHASCAETARSAGRRSRCAAPGSRAAPASSPSKASEPSLIGSSPAIRRRSVVLPEPEGPSSARSSPGATREIDANRERDGRRSSSRRRGSRSRAAQRRDPRASPRCQSRCSLSAARTRHSRADLRPSVTSARRARRDARAKAAPMLYSL